MNEHHRLAASRMQIMHARAGYLNESLFVYWFGGLLLHDKESFLANPLIDCLSAMCELARFFPAPAESDIEIFGCGKTPKCDPGLEALCVMPPQAMFRF